jgi:hypothetical protein
VCTSSSSSSDHAAPPAGGRITTWSLVNSLGGVLPARRLQLQSAAAGVAWLPLQQQQWLGRRSYTNRPWVG